MEKRKKQKLLMLLTIPAVNLLKVIAQYRAAHDEIRNMKIKVREV
jgi:hypothetical protein